MTSLAWLQGQLELIGGTFFEAILSTIPDDDKVNQLKLLRDFVEKKFQTPVNGAWVTERVWEPHFPKFYNEAVTIMCSWMIIISRRQANLCRCRAITLLKIKVTSFLYFPLTRN